jgi:hypothetical protein
MKATTNKFASENIYHQCRPITSVQVEGQSIHEFHKQTIWSFRRVLIMGLNCAALIESILIWT